MISVVSFESNHRNNNKNSLRLFSVNPQNFTNYMSLTSVTSLTGCFSISSQIYWQQSNNNSNKYINSNYNSIKQKHWRHPCLLISISNILTWKQDKNKPRIVSLSIIILDISYHSLPQIINFLHEVYNIYIIFFLSKKTLGNNQVETNQKKSRVLKNENFCLLLFIWMSPIQRR